MYRPFVAMLLMSASLAAAQKGPMLVRSSLAPASTVFVREFPGRNDTFVRQLDEVCEAAGVELHIVPAGEPYAENHIWLQDAVEFLELADGSGTVALAGRRNRAIDHFAKDRLPNIYHLTMEGYRKEFAEGEGGVSWIDWYGNLEASPPTDKWPDGRILYGIDPASGAQMDPAIIAFLASQGRQKPLALDVGWLTIKHVDEMVSFLPAAGNDFRAAVPNPLVAISLLKRLERRGHGDVPLLTTFEKDVTVSSLLADEDFIAANEKLWLERIEPMVKELRKGIGVSSQRVIGLPVLFQPNGLPRTPNVVNGLVLPGREGAMGQVVMADPNGPIIDGQDAWQAEVRKRLGMVNATIHFVDDRQYHKWSGNVHCATNAIRPVSP